jgi:hypothetical protein
MGRPVPSSLDNGQRSPRKLLRAPDRKAARPQAVKENRLAGRVGAA